MFELVNQFEDGLKMVAEIDIVACYLYSFRQWKPPRWKDEVEE